MMLLVVLGAGCTADDDDDDDDNDSSGDDECTGDLKLTSVDSQNAPSGFAEVFSKQVNVCGLRVYATQTTDDVKVLHVANVLAQYIDNDENTQADNENVIGEMRERQAAMIMFASENEFESMIDELPEIDLDSMDLQAQWGSETFPGDAADQQFDATLEEVFHLVCFSGFSRIYPDIFGMESGSAIADCMDIARGGHFEEIPASYPEDAWYTYDDETCDYECMVIEYFYWGMSSILGAQDYPWRLEEIENEWRLNSAEKMQQGDPCLYELLTDPVYGLPTVLPDGSYTP